MNATPRPDRAVVIRRLGGPEVLEIEERATPQPGPGEILVRVHAAGLNPVDYKIFAGAPSRYPIELPSGNGNDFAGVVTALGEGVTRVRIGDAVMGGCRFHAQADHLVTSADRVIPVPEGLPLELAGALDIAGRTAVASVDALDLGPADTVLVGAAAGGVGIIATQLALRTGTRVIGTAGPDNQERLRQLGAVPVLYGDGLVDRIHAVSRSGITAALDNAGRGTVQAALEAGAPASRINTIADTDAIERHGVLNVGGHTATGLDEIRRIAALVAAGEVVVPLEAEYPLERVREAYEHLMTGHLAGKIVLRLV